MDNVAIRIEGVSKDFKLPHEKITSVKSFFVNPFKSRSAMKTETQHALKDVSFEIKKGEFFGIVGRNGSGKSTLLKIIAGIYQPTKGNIQINGRLVPFIELGVGFNPELTGRENVYLNGALMGFSTSEIESMYDDIVKFAELEEFMGQKLKNYSSGMQVRLAFSVATRANADILLIDEVLAVGDADFQRKCFDYFKSLKRAKKTVIFVSHDMSAIREYCDRAVLINDSRLVHEGTATVVAGEYDRLFLRDIKEAEEGDKQSNRWGEGQVITKSISATSGKDWLKISQVVEAQRDVDSPIIGFRLRDGSGKELTGTNFKIEQVSLGMLHKGEQRTVEWKMPNILSDGSYFVDPAILLADGITTADWWDEAIKVTIHKSRRLPYIADPGFSIRVSK